MRPLAPEQLSFLPHFSSDLAHGGGLRLTFLLCTVLNHLGLLLRLPGLPSPLGPPGGTGHTISREVRLLIPCKDNMTQKIDQEELKSLWQGLLGSQLGSQLR